MDLSTNSQWDTDMSVAACTELGYSDSGKSTIRMDKLTWFFILEVTTIRTIKFGPNPNPPIILSVTVKNQD